MPSCSLSFFFTGYVVHVTRGDTQGWRGRAISCISGSRLRDTRGELDYTPHSSHLHYMVEEMGWSRAMPGLYMRTYIARRYGGRGAVRAGVWTTPLPRKASILPCATKAAHYTPCCPTFAFPSPRRMTQFSRGLRRSRTDIGAEDGTTTPEGATRTVQRDLGILLARCYSP